MRRDIDALVREFEKQVLNATSDIYRLMEERETIDVVEWMLAVLFFRDCHIFETVVSLLEDKLIVGADLLLRPLFEGTVTLEWALVDPRDRAQRLHKESLEGFLELFDSGFLTETSTNVANKRDAQECWAETNLKRLPHFRERLESLDTYRKGYAYDLYRYLSKNIHGACIEWDDFLDCAGEHPRVCPIRQAPSGRIRSCRAVASFLQSKNVQLISSFDRALHSESAVNLENMWELLHVILYAEEKREETRPSDFADRGEGSRK